MSGSIRRSLRLKHLVFALMAACASANGIASHATEPQPLVICPAIDQDATARTNYPGEPHSPIGLVVLGTCRIIAEPNAGENQFEVQVEKVLYGSVRGSPCTLTIPGKLATASVRSLHWSLCLTIPDSN